MNKAALLLFIPVMILLGWVISVQTAVSTGTQIVMPVQGFDPRDILAGHYLQVSVDYSSFKNECPRREDCQSKKTRCKSEYWKKTEAFFCPDTGKIVLNKPADCTVFIKGVCHYGLFFDNISRFYIPEKLSRPLEQAVRKPENDPQLLLSVSRDGRAFPRDLILDGLPFSEWLKQHKE